MRSKLYFTSSAVISRLTGGWNMTPWRRWKTYVLPPFVGCGTSVARLGISFVPAMPGAGA